MATLNIPEKGKYMVTVSSFLRGNANTYLTVDLTKGDICPGACKIGDMQIMEFRPQQLQIPCLISLELWLM